MEALGGPKASPCSWGPSDHKTAERIKTKQPLSGAPILLPIPAAPSPHADVVKTFVRIQGRHQGTKPKPLVAPTLPTSARSQLRSRGTV